MLENVINKNSSKHGNTMSDVELKFGPEIVQVKEEPEEHFVLFLSRPQMHLVKVERDEEQEEKMQINSQNKVEVKKFKCEICERSYSSNGNLITHKKIHFKSEKEKFECEICGYKSFYKERVKVHMIKHIDYRLFKCFYDKCDKAFKTQSHLNRHQMTHSNVYQYECEECSRLFKTKKEVGQHRKTMHTGMCTKFTQTN